MNSYWVKHCFDNLHRDRPVCPHCSFFHTCPTDVEFLSAETAETECDKCGNDYEITRNVSVTYSTSRLKTDA